MEKICAVSKLSDLLIVLNTFDKETCIYPLIVCSKENILYFMTLKEYRNMKLNKRYKLNKRA